MQSVDKILDLASSKAQMLAATLNGDTQKNREIKDAVQDALTLIDICRDTLSIRTSAGESGQMYLDAILRMVDGLTEAAMLILEALQNNEKCVENEESMAAWYAMSESFTTYAVVEAAKASAFMAAGGLLDAGGAAVAEAPDSFIIEKPSKPAFAAGGGSILGAGTKVNLAAGKFSAGCAPLEELSATCSTQAGIAGQKAMTHDMWAIMDLVQAAIKIAQVVIDTVSWAMQVIGVPPVPFLPLPVCGWGVVDPYDWVPGDVAAEIFPEPVEIVENIAEPEMIVQGPNVVPKINDFIIDEEMEIPSIGFNAGGTIFGG